MSALKSGARAWSFPQPLHALAIAPRPSADPYRQPGFSEGDMTFGRKPEAWWQGGHPGACPTGDHQDQQPSHPVCSFNMHTPWMYPHVIDVFRRVFCWLGGPDGFPNQFVPCRGRLKWGARARNCERPSQFRTRPPSMDPCMQESSKPSYIRCPGCSPIRHVYVGWVSAVCIFS